MHRLTKEELKKHPEWRGRDVTATRLACEKFRNRPTAILNFVEGTRYTPAKAEAQHSPFAHLLKPKAGGIAHVLLSMGDMLQYILNITIIYPPGRWNAWDFFCGRISSIRINVECLPITPSLLGDYSNDNAFRVAFQAWLNSIWQAKDELITKEQAKFRQKTTTPEPSIQEYSID